MNSVVRLGLHKRAKRATLRAAGRRPALLGNLQKAHAASPQIVLAFFLDRGFHLLLHPRSIGLAACSAVCQHELVDRYAIS